MVRVLASADLPSGEAGDTAIRLVQAGDREVLVARLNSGRVVAFGALCPHQGTDLSNATFWDGNVRCPRHNYLYDSVTGENILPSRDCRPESLWKLAPGYLPVHRTEEREGWVWVAEEPSPPPSSFDPARERPPGPGEVAPTAQPLAGPRLIADTEESRAEVATALSVRAGATFELRLRTQPRPGYVWRVKVPPELLFVVEERFEPGSPPRHRVKLAARSVGTGQIQCTYVRPWEATPAEARTYDVTVEPA
jgi:prepilin-type processing-associated H-X9-DG protein